MITRVIIGVQIVRDMAMLKKKETQTVVVVVVVLDLSSISEQYILRVLSSSL